MQSMFTKNKTFFIECLIADLRVDLLYKLLEYSPVIDVDTLDEMIAKAVELKNTEAASILVEYKNKKYPQEKLDCSKSPFDTNVLQPGELYDEWVTIRPLNSIQPRGKCIDTTSRYLCSECNRLRYISSSFFYVDGTFDYDTMYEYGGLIVPERIFERIKDMDWKKNNLYKPAKIKIIKKLNLIIFFNFVWFTISYCFF
mgnify:CR=1 FL=1